MRIAGNHLIVWNKHREEVTIPFSEIALHGVYYNERDVFHKWDSWVFMYSIPKKIAKECGLTWWGVSTCKDYVFLTTSPQEYGSSKEAVRIKKRKIKEVWKEIRDSHNKRRTL